MGRIYINKGEKVFYKGILSIIIKIIDIKRVTIEEVESSIVHTVEILELNSFESTKSEDLMIYSENEWDSARKKYKIIEPIIKNRRNLKLVKKISIENNVSLATLYRWLKKYEETGLVSTLINEKRGSKKKSRLSEEVDNIIENIINKVYLTSSKKSIPKTIREVKLALKEKGILPPHDNTIRNRINNLSIFEVVRKRNGIKTFREKYQPIIDNFPSVEYPLAVVQIDHTPVDIILVDEVNRLPYKRPWLTVALDIYSRIVIGFYLSFETPGTLGTAMCISHSILSKETWLKSVGVEGDWPCWGLMDSIHVDNAKEFRGKALGKACLNYGIKLDFRPIGKPNYGGHIERLMGTFAKEIHNLPGTTFSSKEERGIYNSEKNASFTLKEFEKWLTFYIVNIYNEKKHSSIGMSPKSKYLEGIYGNENIIGRGIPPLEVNEFKLKLDFMPFVERTIQEYGIVIDHIFYFDDVLRPFINSEDKYGIKRKFIFRKDPRDISVVYFYNELTKDYDQIPYRNLSFPPISIWEYNEVVKKLKENNQPINEDKIFEAYKTLNELERISILKTKKRKRKIKNNNYSFKDEFITNHPKTNLVEEKFIDLDIKPFDEIDDETFR